MVRAGGTGSSASAPSASAVGVSVASRQPGCEESVCQLCGFLSTVTHHISGWWPLHLNVNEPGPGGYFSHRAQVDLMDGP